MDKDEGHIQRQSTNNDGERKSLKSTKANGQGNKGKSTERYGRVEKDV